MIPLSPWVASLCLNQRESIERAASLFEYIDNNDRRSITFFFSRLRVASFYDSSLLRLLPETKPSPPLLPARALFIDGLRNTCNDHHGGGGGGSSVADIVLNRTIRLADQHGFMEPVRPGYIRDL